MRGMRLRWPLKKLTNGRPVDLINFEQKAALLAAGYALVTIDVRGTGVCAAFHSKCLVCSEVAWSFLHNFITVHASIWRSASCDIIVPRTFMFSLLMCKAECALVDELHALGALSGAGASYGRWRMPWSPEEREDSGEILAWITRQPWSNGQACCLLCDCPVANLEHHIIHRPV
jgi:hypothetical protein